MGFTLEEARAQAKEKLKWFCMVYKDCDGDPSRFCQGQHYGRPLGIGGIGSGASFHNNWLALRRIHLRAGLVRPHETVDTSFDFFGHTLTSPVMAASVSGIHSFGGEDAITEKEFCRAVVLGCRDAGTVGWRGDTFTYTFNNTPCIDAIAEAQGHGVKIIKPRSQEDIEGFIRLAESAGALAVGVDIDGCASFRMNSHGTPVFRKSRDELAHLAAATKLPFIIKGIMNVRDAEEAVRAGAAAIVVSNHGGRVLDHTPGTADVLPEIVSALKGTSCSVYVDGGVRTGYDVLKMLALGARGVLVGRDVIRAAVGAGSEGVRLQMEYLQKTLAGAMLATGVSKLSEIGPECLDVSASVGVTADRIAGGMTNGGRHQ